jgi:hypothetical protein
MANGFSLNDTACRQIHAEVRMMRHFRNSLGSNSANLRPIAPRLFRNTARKIAVPEELEGTRRGRDEAHGCYR